MPRVNEWGQPLGPALEGWVCPKAPPRRLLEGRYCRVEPLDVDRHATALFEANRQAPDGRDWTYLPYGPFETLESYVTWLRDFCLADDPLFFTIVDVETATPVGVASYMRIMPASGAMEVGHLKFSPQLQKHRAATEAMYLMMKNAFALGYRRYEWKCDSFNAPSRAAAERYGFSYEGTFRNATVQKRRSRDTAWYSITVEEWPELERAFLQWLAPANFDEHGAQRARLSELTRKIRAR